MVIHRCDLWVACDGPRDRNLDHLRRGLFFAVLGASLAGLPIGNAADSTSLTRLVMELVRAWIALAGLASTAYAVTFSTKSQMAGIGTVIGYFVLSISGAALLPDSVTRYFKFLPFSAATDALGLQGPPGQASTGGLDPNVALLVMVGWLVGSIAVACLFVERAEITG